MVVIASQTDLDPNATTPLVASSMSLRSNNTSAPLPPLRAKRPAPTSPDENTNSPVPIKRHHWATDTSSCDVSTLAFKPVTLFIDLPLTTTDTQILRSTALFVQARQLRQLLAACQQREQETLKHTNELIISHQAELAIKKESHDETKDALAQARADYNTLRHHLAITEAACTQKDVKLAELENHLADIRAL
jgi:hypothetical protein